MLDNSNHTDILGLRVAAVDLSSSCRLVEGWVNRREHTYVCVTNVHGVMESQRNPHLLKAQNSAGMVVPDGMPLVWLSRIRGQRSVGRVYGPDLMLELCRRSAGKGYRHFFYGGSDGVAERLASRLMERFPHLRIVGTHCPPFRPLTAAETAQVRVKINRSRADFVWVGLGCPKQELWMADHRDHLDAPVLIGVGAAFDFHSGLKKQAPNWMQQAGLEWLFRLCSEPRRLAGRYLKNNPLFVLQILRQSLGGPSDATVSTVQTSGDV